MLIVRQVDMQARPGVQTPQQSWASPAMGLEKIINTH